MKNFGKKFLIIFLTFTLVFGFYGQAWAVAVPIVTTGTSSSVTTTTATLSGILVDSGSSNATERGFEYGLTTGYGTPTTESGTYDTGDYAYSSQFGSAGSGDGQFDNPYYIAIDSSGNLYITDYVNNRVQKFDSSGNFITKWGSVGSSDGQFNTPYGIAIDSLGNVYVADTGNDRIQKFNSSGVYQSQFGSVGSGNGEFDNLNDIFIDSSDNIYATDQNNHRVQKFNSSGVYQSQFGSNGTGNGEFDGPNSITIDSSGNIYVTDSNNHRVQKFTSSGVYQSQFGSSGTGNSEFNYPMGIVYGPDGYLYVADNGNSRIQKFDTSGNYVSEYGSVGTGDGEFTYISDLVFDSNNNMYIVDNDAGNRVQKFTKTPISFTANLTGLTCNTTYHYRAYSTNTAGTGTGSDDTFTTSACPVAAPTGGAVPVWILQSMNNQQTINQNSAPVIPSIPTPQPTPQPKFQFTKNLKYRDRSTDVLELQKFLNSNGYILSNTGAGSIGFETTYFGPATRNALTKFQKDNNIKPAVGYFGVITRGVVNK